MSVLMGGLSGLMPFEGTPQKYEQGRLPLLFGERYRLAGYPASGISALNLCPDFTTP